jgi:hypothetical protein
MSGDQVCSIQVIYLLCKELRCGDINTFTLISAINRLWVLLEPYVTWAALRPFWVYPSWLYWITGYYCESVNLSCSFGLILLIKSDGMWCDLGKSNVSIKELLLTSSSKTVSTKPIFWAFCTNRRFLISSSFQVFCPNKPVLWRHLHSFGSIKQVLPYNYDGRLY